MLAVFTALVALVEAVPAVVLAELAVVTAADALVDAVLAVLTAVDALVDAVLAVVLAVASCGTVAESLASPASSRYNGFFTFSSCNSFCAPRSPDIDLGGGDSCVCVLGCFCVFVYAVYAFLFTP